MAKVEEKGRPNYSKFDSLDTAVLEAILQADFDAPEAERIGAEEALYIASLLAERQNKKHKDAEALMGEFFAYYYPCEELYAFDDSDNEMPNDTIQGESSEKKVLVFVQKGWRRFASAVAVLVLFMCVGTATAYALGYDPIEAITYWNAQNDLLKNTSVTTELVNLMADYQDTELVPKWLPYGYLLENIEHNELGTRFSLSGVFKKSHSNKKILINYTIWNNLFYDNISMNIDAIKRLYEIDSTDIAKYSTNNIDYYILGSDERRTIAWTNKNWECSVVGNLSMDEALKIINSIYEE